MAAAGDFRTVFGDAAGLQDSRHALSEWLDEIPDAAPIAADVVSAAAELCANALLAPASKTELRARVEGPSIVVDVIDDGPGIACGLPEEPPAPLEESGRGLYVVRRLVDVLWITALPDGGTRATFARRLAP